VKADMPTLRKYFVTGLLILVPLAITLWVLNLIVSTMDQTLLLLPLSIRNEFPFNVPGMGVVLTLLIIVFVGGFARNFVGRRLVRWWEALLHRIPVVSSIYSSVKQVSDTLFSPSGQAFRRAVLVQFPRDGSWSVGFVVGDPGASLSRSIGEGVQTVYVPTAPNPTSGYILILPPAEIINLDITVDDALKFVVSMGVAVPAERAAAIAALSTPPRSNAN
jgi:uncharacterized membrane protein